MGRVSRRNKCTFFPSEANRVDDDDGRMEAETQLSRRHWELNLFRCYARLFAYNSSSLTGSIEQCIILANKTQLSQRWPLSGTELGKSFTWNSASSHPSSAFDFQERDYAINYSSCPTLHNFQFEEKKRQIRFPITLRWVVAPLGSECRVKFSTPAGKQPVDGGGESVNSIKNSKHLSLRALSGKEYRSAIGVKIIFPSKRSEVTHAGEA